MPPGLLVHHAQEALMLALAMSLPVVLLGAAVGLLVAAVQAATQIQDPTIAHLPRFLTIAVVLSLLGPWMGHQVGAFAKQMFLLAAG